MAFTCQRFPLALNYQVRLLSSTSFISQNLCRLPVPKTPSPASPALGPVDAPVATDPVSVSKPAVQPPACPSLKQCAPSGSRAPTPSVTAGFPATAVGSVVCNASTQSSAHSAKSGSHHAAAPVSSAPSVEPEREELQVHLHVLSDLVNILTLIFCSCLRTKASSLRRLQKTPDLLYLTRPLKTAVLAFASENLKKKLPKRALLKPVESRTGSPAKAHLQFAAAAAPENPSHPSRPTMLLSRLTMMLLEL